MALRVLSTRLYSSVAPQRSPGIREMVSAPVFKTLLLTLLFGSVVVEYSRNKRELNTLQAAYESRFQVLREATAKIRRREPVDVAAELKLANSLTRNRYSSVKDVEMEQLFEDFLKYALDPEPAKEPKAEKVEARVKEAAPVKKSSEFL